jgi:hypothetical protein
MSDQCAVDAVLAFLESPGLAAEAGSSPAVRATLQGLLEQVLDEIATLSPVLAQDEVAERERIQHSLEIRQQIVARIRAVLDLSDEAVSQPSRATVSLPQANSRSLNR